MRKSIAAFRALIAIGFKAAPWQASFQMLTGIIMSLGGPAAVYCAKLLVDAAVARDLRLGLIAATGAALTVGLSLVNIFYYVDCVFVVIERSGALANRRLMEILGKTEGLAHFELPEYLDQVQRIREDSHGLASMVNATTGVMRAAVSLIASGALLGRMHPALLVLPIFGVISFWFGRRSQELALAAQAATSETERLRRHLFEVGTSAALGKEMRMFGLARVLLDRHHTVSEDVLQVRNRATWQGMLLQAIEGVISALVYVGTAGLMLTLAVAGRATAGDVVLAIGLAVQLGGVVRVAVSYGNSFLWVMKAAKRFVWLEDYARGARRAVEMPAPVPERLREGIDLSDLTFKYPGAARPVLHGVSVFLPAGKVVALVGDNGAGKSTLVKLLCSFYPPTSGQMLVDGVDVARFPTEEWRDRTSAAFQDFARFEFTAGQTVGIGDLPRMGNLGAITSALERAGASGVVDILPRGLQSQLGSAWGGVDLSGGQWQKLALARGLMRTDALLAVFDEPTAALDPQTEHALFERFAEAARAGHDRGTITLLVSHRFSTVRMADLIIVLDGGKVLEAGSHQELMNRGGLYAELYELQSRAYR